MREYRAHRIRECCVYELHVCFLFQLLVVFLFRFLWFVSRARLQLRCCVLSFEFLLSAFFFNSEEIRRSPPTITTIGCAHLHVYHLLINTPMNLWIQYDQYSSKYIRILYTNDQIMKYYIYIDFIAEGKMI